METLKVLVVDDEPGIRLGIARVLQGLHGAFPAFKARWRSRSRRPSPARRRFVSAAAPDILLLDHKLPGISGLEVLDLTSRKPHTGSP